MKGEKSTDHPPPVIPGGSGLLGRRGKPSFVFLWRLRGLGPHSPGLRLSHHHLETPRLKPENPSNGCLLCPRATAGGGESNIFLLPLSPVEPGKALPPPPRVPWPFLHPRSQTAHSHMAHHWVTLLPDRGPCLAAGWHRSAAHGGHSEPPWGQSLGHAGPAGCVPVKGPRRPGRWQIPVPETSPHSPGTFPGGWKDRDGASSA